MICEGARAGWGWGNVRAAGEDDPAYLVRQDTGRRVLKSAGEDERGGD